MTFEPTTEADDSPVNMTTLVDVVFILLSFFVLTAKFGHERDVTIGADPPIQAGAAAQSGDLPERIVVRISPGELEGEPQITIGRTALPGIPAITAKLVEIDLPAVPVVLAADERLSIDQVARAMDAVLASPMKRLSLSGLSRDGELP